jgi:putative glutamine amidotransferase
MPLTVSREAVAHCVHLADGVVLTGGDDVTPALYTSRIPKKLRQKLLQPDPARDLREMLIIDEVFRQGKPLLAICRGLQILNVALGGTLWLDIGTQLPHAIEHNRQDLKSEVSHDVQLTSDSLLAKITGLDSLRVNSTHHQAVARAAPLLRVTGRSPDGVVEVMELRPHKLRSVPFLLGVQFHPERLVDRHPEQQAVFEGFALACRLIGKQKDYEAKSIGSGRCK